MQKSIHKKRKNRAITQFPGSLPYYSIPSCNTPVPPDTLKHISKKSIKESTHIGLDPRSIQRTFKLPIQAYVNSLLWILCEIKMLKAKPREPDSILYSYVLSMLILIGC